MKRKFVSVSLSAALIMASMTACSSQNSDKGKEEAGAETSVATTEESDASLSADTAALSDSAEEASTQEHLSSDGASTADTDPAEGVTGESAVPTKDLAGNDISVPTEVEKIVSMSPSSTRLLIDLGLADKITGCDTYSFEYYGKDLSQDIPQFDMMQPDQEALVSMKPDIIFTTGMSYAGGTDVYASVRESGVCLADIPTPSSIDGIAESISFVGGCTGESEEAEAIVKDMENTLDEISAAAEKIGDRKKVLYTSSTPTAESPALYSAGKDTYIDEAIALIGAENVTADQDPWASVTEEAAIAMNPDVIISTDTYTPDAVKALTGLSGWEKVSAIEAGQVYLLDTSNELNQPNQHVVSAIVEMAKDIYPDVYGDIRDPFAQ